ncbi:M20/M25/M40 family metallo-hydrolase [Bacillus sp. CGMCC 1.16541]|uniref:M20/M25/M40 family metallo-hydrolase n=1 Tax=Bacillus sp. CGMCC 1.16541 TaxID=2185143 RepID=UPI000D72E9A7|nr:M20/M25/M40 family metallo-hydrolase [Bacillus sp. CGMCC 1.16541]
MKKPLLSLAVATSLTFGALTVPAYAKPIETVPAYEKFQNVLDQKVIDRINVENIYNNIDYLAQQPRVAGTEDEHKAAQFIKEQFQSYGYKAQLEEFKYVGYTPASKVELAVDGFNLKPTSFTYSVSGNVTGEVEYAGLGTKDELANKNLTGKIALIQRGAIPFGEKVLNAAEKGATAVIIYNNADGTLNGTLGGANNKYVPAVSLSKSEGEALLNSLKNGTSLQATVNIEGAEVSERTSYNVTATKAPNNKKKATNDIVVVGAHYDSVPGSPGANDDASGTAMTLELARVFKDLPTDTELRFVTFGAEEIGLLGSRAYVKNLTEDEIDRTVAMFNLDMVGSRDAGNLVLRTVDGKPNLVTELSQASSTRLNGSPTPYGQGGSSDHVPFGEVGIPAALFIHSPAEPWYHTPEDSIDKISKEKLQDVAEIVGTAVYDRVRPDHQGPKPTKGKKQATPHLYHEQEIQ